MPQPINRIENSLRNRWSGTELRRQPGSEISSQNHVRARKIKRQRAILRSRTGAQPTIGTYRYTHTVESVNLSRFTDTVYSTYSNTCTTLKHRSSYMSNMIVQIAWQIVPATGYPVGIIDNIKLYMALHSPSPVSTVTLTVWLEMVGSAKCGLSFAGLHEKS